MVVSTRCSGCEFVRVDVYVSYPYSTCFFGLFTFASAQQPCVTCGYQSGQDQPRTFCFCSVQHPTPIAQVRAERARPLLCSGVCVCMCKGVRVHLGALVNVNL